ncbi:MAG: class I SAM-dependent RNA methyltransferase [Bryobacterales bacterium]|nr:class I SAM-dependent RNA methyltransferase [Bryobacteraceae bacterium]MDW8355429.1 class I SAM-dependent RNA methyltransferase [Bryobacterales bacterium]
MEKWIYGGKGLGRLEGRAVLVPYVLPGETARVRIAREKPGWIEADLVEVLAPAPGRIPAPCPYFQRCGGCHYQHAAYETQLEQKRRVLVEVLRRIGKMEPPESVEVIAGPDWEYRNRTQFHLDGRQIGYMEPASHRLCSVERCAISSPKINEALAALRGMLHHRRFPRFVRCIELFTNESQVQLNVLESRQPVARSFFEWCAERIPGAAAGSLDYPAAGGLFRVSHGSFFQTNRFLIDRLVECVVEGKAGRHAVDLYAGVGLFSLPLARCFEQVTAVEAARNAFQDLEFNAARAAVAVRAVRSTSEAFLERCTEPVDLIVADPPRMGLGSSVVRGLLRVRPPLLVIVSCDPATLARDLRALVAGGYRLTKLTFVDLFPQTFHIESVAELTA